jgi:hypothetical protein
MVSRAESGLSAEGPHHDRIALDVQDVSISVPVDPDGPVWDGHDNSEPFAVIGMPENTGYVVPREGIVRLHAVFVKNIFDQFPSGHIAPLGWGSLWVPLFAFGFEILCHISLTIYIPETDRSSPQPEKTA